MSDHAPLAPSAANVWGHCAGSYRAQKDIPDHDTAEAREGTATHEVASLTLQSLRGGMQFECAYFIGTTMSNGVVVSREMAESAQVFVDDVADVCNRLQCWGELLIEHRVHMPYIHPQHNWGTLDAAVRVGVNGFMFIILWDFKHGHRAVDPEDNYQLANYAKGLCEYYGLDGGQQNSYTIDMRIVSPRVYDGRGPVKSCAIPITDLRAHWNILHNKANEALGDNPRLTTGDWCRDCKAVGRCGAAMRAGCNTVHMINHAYSMCEMSPSDMAIEYEMLLKAKQLFDARLSDLEQSLTFAVKDGAAGVPYTLEATKGRGSEWLVDDATVRATGAMYGLDWSKSGSVTPNQAIDSAPAGKKEDVKKVVKELSRKKQGGTRLVRIENTLAHSVFGNKRIQNHAID